MKKLFMMFAVLVLMAACGKEDSNDAKDADNQETSDPNTEIDDTPTATSPDDYRGLMRDFVTLISKQGKTAKPGFVVIPQNGVQLVTTGEESDSPLATQYLAAIDGHGQEDIFYGNPDDNVASSEDDIEWLRGYLDQSKQQGNVILCIDYCSTEAKMEDSREKNAAADYIAFQATERNLNVIPSYTPYNENDKEIKSLKDVQNFLYILELSKFKSKDDFISKVCATNYDLIVMDLFFYDDLAFTAEDVERLRQKANGGKRMVVCYMSIGEAEDYRFYWQEDWKNNPPEFLDEENPDWEGNYKVKYWTKSWQDVILNQYLPKIIDAGYDGVYLDIIDAFEYYEE
ncbi:MAG: endo alpha-1,4 polygalactosaminidase [Bacteroidales bacterium]|nr:endo alpha-1,4 polygalactosaminidase [Bacteroidales bacterium]